jgi:hypothetical protein
MPGTEVTKNDIAQRYAAPGYSPQRRIIRPLKQGSGHPRGEANKNDVDSVESSQSHTSDEKSIERVLRQGSDQRLCDRHRHSFVFLPNAFFFFLNGFSLSLDSGNATCEGGSTRSHPCALSPRPALRSTAQSSSASPSLSCRFLCVRLFSFHSLAILMPSSTQNISSKATATTSSRILPRRDLPDAPCHHPLPPPPHRHRHRLRRLMWCVPFPSSLFTPR